MEYSAAQIELSKLFENTGYLYFINETASKTTLSVLLKNGMTFETAKKDCSTFVKDFSDIINTIKELDVVLPQKKYKYTINQKNDDSKLYFDLMKSEPSDLKFNSYSELCEYCVDIENFKNYKITDIAAIISAAEKFFPVRINELAELHNLPKPDEVVVENQGGRLGVCWRSIKIGLNIVLLSYDTKSRESVFVHELCHLVHNNHSTDFKNLLKSKLGKDFKERYYLGDIANEKLHNKLEQFYNKKIGKKKNCVKCFQDMQRFGVSAL